MIGMGKKRRDWKNECRISNHGLHVGIKHNHVHTHDWNLLFFKEKTKNDGGHDEKDATKNIKSKIFL